MTGDDKSKGAMDGPKTIPKTSPLYLHPSESPNLNVPQIVFDGNNYDLWAAAVKNGLDAKNKLAFIESRIKKPVYDEEEETVESVAWRQCNAMIRAWLRNVIDPKLHSSITFTQPVDENWEELRGRYSAGNAPRVHQSKGDLNECKQGNDSVVEYYTRLRVIWDELANYSTVKACTCGAAASIAKEREEEKVHQFLMGLDSKLYGNIRTNLLMEDPIANIKRVYGLILREERHVSITKVKEEKVEAAMEARIPSTGRGRGGYHRTDIDEDNPPPYVEWLIDSGCSHHMTGKKDLLKNIWREDSSTDRTTRMTIGQGEHRQGVYYYKPKRSEKVRQVTVEKEGRLGHKRLGHPSKSIFSRFSALVGRNLSWNSDMNQQLSDLHTDDFEGDVPHVVSGRTDTGEREIAEAGPNNDASVDAGEAHNTSTNAGSFEHGTDAPDTGTEHAATNAQNDRVEERMGRGAREKFEPSWKKDYYCKSTRIIHPKSHAHHEQSKSSSSGTRYPLANYVATNCFSHSHKSFLAKIDKNSDPTYSHEAAKSVEWRKAMRKEIDALEGNGTWKIVNLPEGKKPIGGKWVYKIKYRANGEIERYKARLLAQGFTQVEGIDFHETYAPVAKMTSVRYDMIVVVSNDKKACANVKVFLDKQFGIKDLGQLKFFLGIEVDQGANGLFLNQRKYAMSIVEDTGMAGAKTTHTPIQPRHNLSLARGYVFKDIMKYRRLVGRLVYLTITRPDLVYTVHILSQFVNESRKEHWEAALRVVRYIKGNPSKGITFKKRADYQLKGYCDSDYASCPIIRRSLSGYFVSIGESPISWRAKKQVTVA
ncbi:uncharacterized protein LOC141648796 [Silene latifolia]|uniref:uncharacterized protein LOC141648796 n=1 Tax=Silene latifolia TaxID=37657 RepID=UPI003D76CB48